MNTHIPRLLRTRLLRVQMLMLALGAAPPAGTPAVYAAALGLCANDTEFLGDTYVPSSYQASSANGGTVVVNNDGSFTYLPPVNFTGTDTCTYTLRDSVGLTGT